MDETELGHGIRPPPWLRQPPPSHSCSLPTAPGDRQTSRPSLWKELEAGWSRGFAPLGDPEPDREFKDKSTVLESGRGAEPQRLGPGSGLGGGLWLGCAQGHLHASVVSGVPRSPGPDTLGIRGAHGGKAGASIQAASLAFAEIWRLGWRARLLFGRCAWGVGRCPPAQAGPGPGVRLGFWPYPSTGSPGALAQVLPQSLTG